MEVGLYVVYRFIRNEYVRLILPMTAGCILHLTPSALAHSFDIGLIFFPIGFCAAEYYLKESNKILQAVSFIIPVIVSALDMSSNSILILPIYIVSGIAGAYFVLGISRLLEDKDVLMDSYGRNTLTILGTHNCFLLPIRYFTGIEDFSVLMGVAVILFIMIVEIPVIYLFDRYVPFLIGKKRR